MSRFGMWDPRKNDDYEFFDDAISELFELGGTGIFVHKYLGTKPINTNDPTLPDYVDIKETNIQDLLFLENRDRKYDPDVYELYGAYNLQDTEFDVSQFGIFLEADTLYLEFHLNDTIKKLGRKLMSGDVLELPHLRDDTLLDEDKSAINKFYVVKDVNRAAGGYSPTWFPHIIRVKISPMPASKEFSDILDQEIDEDGDGIGDGTTIGDIISDYHDQIKISDAIIEQAESQVPFRNFETMHFYIVPGDEDGKQYPWVYAGDGTPPNGAELLGSGTEFPEDADDGSWFLRTDYDPYVLFKKEGFIWRRKEVDYRKKWHAAHRLLETFINNNNKTNIQGYEFDEKQPVSKAIKPRADF